MAQHSPAISRFDGQPRLRRAAVLFHPRVPAAQELLERVLGVLSRFDVDTVTGSVWGSSDVQAMVDGAEVCFVLGGDGSLLRAARLAAPSGTLLCGINLGRLGFLAEIEPGEVLDRVAQVAEGRYWIEERIMLAARVEHDGQEMRSYDCLNEVALTRRHLSRVVKIETHIDGHYLTTYVADGVLVATPTGSSAYSLAAGGPILHPEVRNLVLTPISAHLSLRSPLVLPDTTIVRLVVHTDHEAGASFDGQSDIEMQSNDAISVRVGPRVARFARTHERAYFYHTLIDKLGIIR